MTKKITQNRIQCKHCSDIIESYHTHDYKKCKCGKVAVDGGLEYLRRSCPAGEYKEHIKELSEFEESYNSSND